MGKEEQSLNGGKGFSTEGKRGMRRVREGEGKERISVPSVAQRQLPQSSEAEQALLSSILNDPLSVLDLCVEKKVTPEFFLNPANAIIYQICLEMRNSHKAVDLVLLSEELRERGLLERVGGIGYLGQLEVYVSTAANASYYVEILREKYLQRRIIMTCTEMASRSYEEHEDVDLLLDEVERRIFEIGESRHQRDTPTFGEEINRAIENIEAVYKNKAHGGITGLPTGFPELDRLTSGLHGGEMVVIAARPSMGKTAFAMNIAEHIAVDLKKPVAIFSLEMSTQQLVQRLLCSRARVNLQKIRDGFLSKADFPNLFRAANQLRDAKIYIDDTAGLSILDLRARARRFREKFGVELIVVDYLQLLRSTSRRAQENRQFEVSEISAGIKGLAKELQIPVLVLSQLNRQPDERGGRPMMSHLRESGSIEQDADLIGMLYRPEVYAQDEEERMELSGKAELLIVKQRNGPIGEIPLTFLKEFTRFEPRSDRKEPNL
ncbi:MAG: replicative DNA helicase [Chthoniobacterales bacterium]|nr:replicative DNA helicase [Chthoniobacterales bacterium]